MAGLPYAAPMRSMVTEDDPLVGFFHKNVVAPMKRGYTAPPGESGMNFASGYKPGVQANAMQRQPGVQPFGQQATTGAPGGISSAGPAPGPSPHAAPGGFGEPAHAAFAAPQHAAFSPPLTGSGAPGEHERLMGMIAKMPERPIGVGERPAAPAYQSPLAAEAQTAHAPAGSGDPARQLEDHDLHPMISQLMRTPGAFQPPQYATQTFQLGQTTDPYPALHRVPGMGFESMAPPQQFHPAPSGPAGPSMAEGVLSALGTGAKMREATGQSDYYHGLAEHARSQSRNPMGLPETPEQIKTAKDLSTLRATGQDPSMSPFSGLPVLQGVLANQGANIGMMRQAFQAEGLNPGDPRTIDMLSKIKAMRGWSDEELMNENAGGRNPFNGIELGAGALPWFPSFKHYQSPESKLNQQFLMQNRRP